MFKLKDICDGAGVEFVTITTDTPLFNAFVRIVEN